MIRKALQTHRRFICNNQGAAAVEFALLLPIILVIYIAAAEFCQAFMVQRRTSHAASQIADIVAQSGQVRKSDLNNFFDVADLIMAPFGPEPIKAKVTSITMDDRRRTIVQWSYAQGLTADVRNAVIAVPTGILENPGDSVILSEAVYSYDSPYDITLPGFPNFLAGITTFRRQFYLRPREVVAVSCLDC